MIKSKMIVVTQGFQGFAIPYSEAALQMLCGGGLIPVSVGSSSKGSTYVTSDYLPNISIVDCTRITQAEGVETPEAVTTPPFVVNVHVE